MKKFRDIARKELKRQGFDVIELINRSSAHGSFIFRIFGKEGRVSVSSSPKNIDSALKSFRKQMEDIKESMKG